MDKVTKKVHKDGSETVIKQVHPAYRDTDGAYFERAKQVTSVFVSSSYGCPYKCAFCHLTEMGVRFKNVKTNSIVDNVKEAMRDHFNNESEWKDIKLCFMGMGDPTIDSMKTLDVFEQLLNAGLDIKEVDISSVSYSDGDVETFNYIQRNFDVKVRLFYSIHTAIPDNRKIIIGSSRSVTDSMASLSDFKGDVFLHYTPVTGLNDSMLDALSICRTVKYWQVRGKSIQVRMLEFNPHEKSVYERPLQRQLKQLYQLFVNNGVSVKWQVSKGYPEKAACGMFDNKGV